MPNDPKMVAYLMKYIKECKGFARVFQQVKIVSAGNGNCLAEYKVAEDVTNLVGSMHGGFSATLVDQITSFALWSKAKHSVPSVSVDLHVTFLKGPKLGEEIIIDAKTMKAGKTMAYLTCEIKDKKTGEILVKGLHTKYIFRSADKL